MGNQSSGDDGDRRDGSDILHDLGEDEAGEDLQCIRVRLLDGAEPPFERLRVQNEYSLNGNQAFLLRTLDEIAVRRDDPTYMTFLSQKTNSRSILSDSLYEIDIDKDQLLVSSRLFNEAGKVENGSPQNE